MKRILCVGGARPNFMKLAPLLAELERSDRYAPLLTHTGQHYDEKMSGSFFRDLGMRPPDYSLGVGSGTHAQQTAEVMKRFEPVVAEAKPDMVVVVGDVNSTVGCALVAVKMSVAVAHVESGLRSFDRTMPEEINRLVTDAISDLLLVSETSGLTNLRREGASEEKLFLVGNLMIDSLKNNLERARTLDVPGAMGLKRGGYGVVTLHRPANVDDISSLNGILEALAAISREVPLVFPVHPRTRQQLDGCEALKGAAIRLAEPLGYLEFQSLMSGSGVVLTDSGGIQEETTAMGIPCFTLRDNTERPSTIEEGTNTLAGTAKESILAAWERGKQSPKTGRTPALWDGRAAARCVEAFDRYFASASA